MNTIIFLHLTTIAPVLFIGPFILFKKKGDRIHKTLGKIWASLMIVSCLLSFGIRDPEGGFSWLHGLAAFTIYSVIRGVLEIRKGNIKAHRNNMLGPYLGALIAMFFAFWGRERLLGEWIRSFF